MKTITYDETKWKLVPVDMTDEQYEAALQHCDGYNRQYYRKWYKAVLSAAPTPEEPAAQRYDHSDDALYLGGKDE